ncbi:hypothetical protein E2C01_022900 [Portunus trituberculatus]|uniref:Uncharacterized protein n=1 Tax=Portunus trituberculatus TaxID=210409 RepID=A0A5B7E8W6_PORTR|nr:hypothetical protein [Portunus trituberculatus]
MVVQPAAGEAVSGAVGDAVCTPHKRILIWTTFWKEQSFAWERIFFSSNLSPPHTTACNQLFSLTWHSHSFLKANREIPKKSISHVPRSARGFFCSPSIRW